MRRSKFSFGAIGMSAREAGAISIMWRARIVMPLISPFAWPRGLPIMRVMSPAISSAFASIHAMAFSQRATRSVTVDVRKPFAAARARSRVASTVFGSASSTVTSLARVKGLSTVRVVMRHAG
jgi:spore maturation protein SpmB